MEAQKSPRETSAASLAVFLGALLLLCAIMVASYYYSYASGKRPEMPSFLALWSREALILIGGLALLVAFVVAALVRRLRGPGA